MSKKAAGLFTRLVIYGRGFKFPQKLESINGAPCRGRGDSPQHRHSPTVIDKPVGSFKSPDRTSEDKTNGLTSLPTDGVAQSSTLDGPVIEPGTFS